MFGPHSLLRSWPCQFLTTILLIAGMTVSAAPPIWWTTPDAANFRVIDPAVTDSNAFGPANVGQGKYIAKRALEALSTAVGGNTAIQTQVVAAIEQELYKTEENSPTGVFFPVVPDEPTPDWLDAQKVPLQIGAMKAMAAPFYRHLSAMNGNWVRDQLIANGLTLGSGFFQDTDGTYYPWNPADNSSTLKNRAPATIGQLKVVFSLRFEALDIDGDGTIDSADQNGDGIPDSTQDSDGDGLTDAQEHDLGTNPNKVDTDDDGLTDAEELQRGTNPKNPNTDGNSLYGDTLKDGEDADPLDSAINWKITPEPRYAFIEIENYSPLTHGSPIMSNKKGQVLFSRAVWENDTWTLISSLVSSSFEPTNKQQMAGGPPEAIHLYNGYATSIDDNGTIVGYANGRSVAVIEESYGAPLVWSNPSNSPSLLGEPATITEYEHDDAAFINRDKMITTIQLDTFNLETVLPMRRFTGMTTSPATVFSSSSLQCLLNSGLQNPEVPRIGRDGTITGRTPGTNGGVPWVWRGSGEHEVVSTANTLNPDPFSGSIDYTAVIQTLGTTPQVGADANSMERPVIKLGSEVLIHNGQKWVRSQSLRNASAISTSGTALTYDFQDPAVWRNGKVVKIKDICPRLAEEGMTSFEAVDINDDGMILIKAPFSGRVGLLIPAAVVEVSPKLVDEMDRAIESSKYPASYPESTEMVERDPSATPTHLNDASAIRIAWRDMKVKIGVHMTGKKVTWSMTPQFTPLQSDGTPEAAPRFRGKWGNSANSVHHHRFSASEKYGANGYESMAQLLELNTNVGVTTIARTTVDSAGYTAIRVNLPSIGFNKARINILIEDTEDEIDLIDLEVPAVVVIDPGHGTGGAVGDSNDGCSGHFTHVQEYDTVLDIGNRTLAEIGRLKSVRHLSIKKYSTKDPANSRANISLIVRAAKAKEFGADVFVSLHFDNSADSPNISAAKQEKIRLYRNPFGMIDEDDRANHTNRNPRADWALALKVRRAVQAGIAVAEPEDSIAASTNAYVAYNSSHNSDAIVQTTELNERHQHGLLVLNDSNIYNGNQMLNTVKYVPCRSTLIEIERVHNEQADNLFNGHTAYDTNAGEANLTVVAESARQQVAIRIADACVQDTLTRDLADQANVPLRDDGEVPQLDFETGATENP